MLTIKFQVANDAYTDITYNSSESLWHCCGRDKNGNVDCSHPTKSTFQAPGPAQLSFFTDPVSSSMVQSTAKPTATSLSSSMTTTSTSTASAQPASSTDLPKSGISTGAKAGIGVGIALGVIVIALLSFFLWRARRRKSDHLDGPPPGYSNSQYTSEQYRPNSHYTVSATQEQKPDWRSTGVNSQLLEQHQLEELSGHSESELDTGRPAYFELGAPNNNESRSPKSR